MNFLRSNKTDFSLLLFTIPYGIITGIVGAFFAHATLFVTDFRLTHPSLLFLLPIGGILITLLYKKCNYEKDGGTDLIVKALSENASIPFRMFPLIFISAVFSHLSGASVGRVGTTFQLGGSLSELFSKKLKLKDKHRDILIMCGISGVFSAMFGTPLTGAILSVELAVIFSPILYALPYTAITSFIARYTGILLGINNASYNVLEFPEINILSFSYIVLLSLLTCLVGYIYILFIDDIKRFAISKLKNPYLRGIIFGTIILLLTLFLPQSTAMDYNGMGSHIIREAFNENVIGYAFLIKIIITSLSFIAGYKGGEVFPAVFIGATFGCAFGGFIGFLPSFCAAIGIGGIFCFITNCPVASYFLCIELFGTSGALFYLIPVVICSLFFKERSLYKSQVRATFL